MVKSLSALLGLFAVGFIGYCYAHKQDANSVSPTQVAGAGSAQAPSSGAAVTPGVISSPKSSVQGVSSLSNASPFTSITTSVVPQTRRLQGFS